jgi:small subunit ribosomal protein S15
MMSTSTSRKTEIVQSYQTKANDTGSPEVQIALLSDRINSLSSHLKTHPKDISSRRGLLLMVAHRRTLLDYIKKIDEDRYLALISKLGLRR